MLKEEDLENVERKHVLIIDDDVDFCLLLKAYFLRKQCTVSIAHTVDDAWASIKQRAPEAVLLNKWVAMEPDLLEEQIRTFLPDAQITILRNQRNDGEQFSEPERVPLSFIHRNDVLIVLVMVIIILLYLQIKNS